MAQRPSPGAGYEVETTLQSYSSPGLGANPGVRVWYVQSSNDAVINIDTNPVDEVPDLVTLVAGAGQAVHHLFVDSLGFRPPLLDSDYLPVAEAGGDSKFDFYIKDFGVGDGSYRRDGCLGSSNRCYGYIEIENDFDTSSYSSLQIAADILVSHEYFHAIQSAYNSDTDAKWSEGTAVWAEEKFNPEQDDFERLISSFLQKPWRPFDRVSGSAFDGWAYGAGLWAWYLDERFGEQIIAEIWQELDPSFSPSTDFLSATDVLLRAQYNSSLEEAWIEFSQWNLFTGSRSDAERAYRNSEHWPEVAFESLVVPDKDALFSFEKQIEGMSTRYITIALPDVGNEKRILSATVKVGHPIHTSAYLLSNGLLSDSINLLQDDTQELYTSVEMNWSGTPLLLLVVTGSVIGAPQQSVGISMSLPIPPPSSSGGGSGCSVKHTALVSRSTIILLLLMLLGTRPKRKSLLTENGDTKQEL